MINRCSSRWMTHTCSISRHWRPWSSRSGVCAPSTSRWCSQLATRRRFTGRGAVVGRATGDGPQRSGLRGGQAAGCRSGAAVQRDMGSDRWQPARVAGPADHLVTDVAGGAGAPQQAAGSRLRAADGWPVGEHPPCRPADRGRGLGGRRSGRRAGPAGPRSTRPGRSRGCGPTRAGHQRRPLPAPTRSQRDLSRGHCGAKAHRTPGTGRRLRAATQPGSG